MDFIYETKILRQIQMNIEMKLGKNPLQYANERQFYKYQTVYDRKREVLEQAAPAAATLGNT